MYDSLNVSDSLFFFDIAYIAQPVGSVDNLLLVSFLLPTEQLQLPVLHVTVFFFV